MKKMGGMNDKKGATKGGFGGADHAIATYGDRGEQHSVGGNDNTIAMKPMAGGRALLPLKTSRRGKLASSEMSGGRHYKNNSQVNEMLKNTGGSALTGLGVPSFLLAANELYKRRRTQGRKTRRGSRRYRK
jgi:hypothetical protein